MRRAKKR